MADQPDYEEVESLFHICHGPDGAFGRAVVHRDGKARLGELLGYAVAHIPATDHGDLLNGSHRSYRIT